MYPRISSFLFIFNISGFRTIRSDATAPGVRGLCSLIRSDYLSSVVDCSALSHPSLEIIAVNLHCFLDAPILILNLYRHLNIKTPFSVYNGLLTMASTFEYALLLGDFNAHHHAWGNARVDHHEEFILHAYDDYQMVLLNDGSSTFISFAGTTVSTVDLTIASCKLGTLSTAFTLPNLYGSDHFSCQCHNLRHFSLFLWYSHKLKLSDIFNSLLSTSGFSFINTSINLISSSSSPLSPLQEYDLFCSFLKDSVVVISFWISSPEEKIYSPL